MVPRDISANPTEILHNLWQASCSTHQCFWKPIILIKDNWFQMLNKQKQKKHTKPSHAERTHNIDEIKINEDLRVRVIFSDPAKLQRNTK